MSTLYVVATPIGNLQDISFRALRILRDVKLIAAEDTRQTRKLLTACDIRTPMTNYHEHNKWAKMDYILESLSEGDVALVSDAGMPGIADPGHELIKTAIQKDIKVVPIPGPSVVITAVAVSGLPTDKFLYLGFLPAKSGSRRRFLESVANESATLITLESPHRLAESLNDIKLILGNRKVAVCRELTKIHEEIFRGTVADAIKHFIEPRGEFVLVIEGKGEQVKPELTPDIREQLSHLLRSGVTAKDAIASLSKETGLSKRELYQAWLTLKGG